MKYCSLSMHSLASNSKSFRIAVFTRHEGLTCLPRNNFLTNSNHPLKSYQRLPFPQMACSACQHLFGTIMNQRLVRFFITSTVSSKEQPHRLYITHRIAMFTVFWIPLSLGESTRLNAADTLILPTRRFSKPSLLFSVL